MGSKPSTLETDHSEISDENIPGTVYLVDAERKLATKHASASSDIILVPPPSSDPDDPLNWSSRRKVLSTACVCVYTAFIGIAASVLYSVIEPFSKDTGLTVNQLNNGTGYMFLLFGWGCLFWQPIALQYGKRPVYLISLVATLAIMIWQPYATSNGQWIAAKILQGFFGAPTETLCEISLADIYFQHERGTYIGLFSFMLAGSNFFAPIIAGFINDGMGYQWVFYWSAIFLGIGLVFCFFFWEETNYDRSYKGSTPTFAVTTNTILCNEKGVHAVQLGNPANAPKSSDQTTNSPQPSAVRKKTYWEKLSVMSSGRRPFYLWKMLPRPLLLLRFPVLMWAGFSYGAHLIWFNVLNGTASSFLSAAPYNFAPSIVGVSYISPPIGVIVASALTGRVGDALVLALARRNRGVLEPEQRLWLFGISAVLIPAGLILWGVGAAHDVHWFGLVFAMGMLGAANTVGVQLSVMYAIDSYGELSGEGIVSVILVRNTMSFAIGYGITPWVDGMGKQNAFITAAFVGLAQALTFLPVIKYGKGLRAASKATYRRYVQQSRDIGLAH